MAANALGQTAALLVVYLGKAFKRGIEYLIIINYLVIMYLKVKAIDREMSGSLQQECEREGTSTQ